MMCERLACPHYLGEWPPSPPLQGEGVRGVLVAVQPYREPGDDGSSDVSPFVGPVVEIVKR